MDDDLEGLGRSEIIESGLDDRRLLRHDGRRDKALRSSAGLKESIAQRENTFRCTCAIAEQIDGRRDPQTLAAGVFEATVEGVICGVGSGPMRANAGVGGSKSGFGSRKRGNTVEGVGVVSSELDCTFSNGSSMELVEGNGVAAGEASPRKPLQRITGGRGGSFGIGTVSSSGVSSGTTSFHFG
jgi:hypothetical protein